MNSQTISDEELQAAIACSLQRLLTHKWAEYSRRGWKADAAKMLAYARQREAEGNVGGKWKLVRALTPMQYEMLRAMKPDGSPDWQQNRDFLRWLPKTDQFEFLKHFKLHEADPSDLGMKTPSGKPK